jgi:hypothetical protein
MLRDIVNKFSFIQCINRKRKKQFPKEKEYLLHSSLLKFIIE